MRRRFVLGRRTLGEIRLDQREAHGIVGLLQHIEARDAREVTHIQGRGADEAITSVQLSPDGSAGFNPAFDVTPARLVTGLITERGTCAATPEGLRSLFPETQE